MPIIIIIIIIAREIDRMFLSLTVGDEGGLHQLLQRNQRVH